MKQILFRLAVALGALVAAVVVAELAVRALDPHGISDTFNAQAYRDQVLEVCGPPRIFRHRPNVDVALRGYSVRTDSRGARGLERMTPKPEGAKRAVFLGDSVTFGWGVEAEETFVALVEADLRERTGAAWETVNLGHMFHDTTQELGVFDEVGVAYEPDLVVLVFVDNDVVPTAKVLGMQSGDPLADSNVSDGAKEVIRTSQRIAQLRPYLPYLSALAAYEYVAQHPAGQAGSIEHAAQVGLDVEEGWELSKAALLALRERCVALDARFVVLDYYELAELAAFCEKNEIAYGSITFTPEQTETDIRNSDADAHANARGHRYLASNVMRELQRLELL